MTHTVEQTGKGAKAPLLCQGCANWAVFQQKCWFYWEGKKECSQFRPDSQSDVMFKSVKGLLELF